MFSSSPAPFWKGNGGETTSRVFQKSNWTSGLVTVLSAESAVVEVDDNNSHKENNSQTPSLVANTTANVHSKQKSLRLEDREGRLPSIHATFVGRSNGMASAPELLLQQKRNHSSPQLGYIPTVSLVDENVSIESLTEALDTRMPNTLTASIPVPRSASSSSSALSADMYRSHSLTVQTDGLEQYTSRSTGRSPASRYGQWLSVNTPEGKTVDDYGFLCDMTDGEGSSDADGNYSSSRNTPKAMAIREIKWNTIMEKFSPSSIRKSKKVRRLVRQGIPDAIRGKVWLYLADTAKYRRPGLYEELKLREPLDIYETIERDIQRCYPNHVLFHEEQGVGQATLHSILKAYAHYNPEVGYCQGMGRLVGLMLMQLDEEATTIDQHMAGYYSPNLGKLRVDAEVFEHLLAGHSPMLAKHLDENGVVPLMYVTQWFLTLFTMALPWETVLRVWDVFYFGGNKFLFRVALGILDVSKDWLLRQCPSNTELLSYLLHLPVEKMQPDDILRAAFRIRLRRQEIDRLARRIEASQAIKDKRRASAV
ncbi:rab-GTPase-TBC domain-containing protein [Syncephalis fuscata]|nr:rab-GTPase-TBC domain-containing protein [Syncephalis fuscata]